MFRKLLHLLFLCGAVVSSLQTVHAHSEQDEPARVEIYPRRDYLTLHVTGLAIDLRDALSPAKNHEEHSNSPSLQAATIQAKASNYLGSHLFLEQNEQVLPLTFQTLRFWKLNAADEGSERFEIFARAARPVHAARTPLSISSTLFGTLKNASTIVSLWGEEKIVQGVQIVQYPLDQTLPSLRHDMANFAWNGLIHPWSSIDHLLFIAALFLAASLLPLRTLIGAMLGFTCAHGVAFSIALLGGWMPSAFLSNTATAFSILLAAGIAFYLSRNAASLAPSIQRWLIGLATLAGFFHSFSGLAPLHVWGLPETGLMLCVLAWTLGIILSHAAMTLILWPTLSYWQRKMTHNAQYGGMTWPRTLQIASILCMALGGYWLLQSVS